MPFGPEEMALIDAIHADPRNDATRLAYADWLEKDGEAGYAEFIRVQCEPPYVAIGTSDGPHRSRSYDFDWDDDAASVRLKRLIELYPSLLASGRFETYRPDRHYLEFRRGLASMGVQDISLFPDGRIPEPSEDGRGLIPCPPLLRLDVILEGNVEAIVYCLNLLKNYRVDRMWFEVAGRDLEELDVEEDFLPEDIVGLSSVDFSFLRGLKEIDLGQVPRAMARVISAKAHEAGVRVIGRR